MIDGSSTMLILALLFAYILFPSWAIVFTNQRGHRGWATAILLLSFLGLGPVLALFGALAAAGSPPEIEFSDPHRRQCPSCGGWKVNGRRATAKTDVYSYLCDLCGYHWSWRKDVEPWPQVRVRLDLIARGEQKLQREAAERRRQEEALSHDLFQQPRK